MNYFAQLDSNNIVTQVIVAEQDFINSGIMGNPMTWVLTSYDTSGGVHKLGGVPIRKNYAGIGYHYDSILDAFIPPKPFASWVLNTTTGLWESPIAYPTDGRIYTWNESTLSWVLLV